MISRLKLAVLGTPIAHSRSPQLQTSFAEDCGIADFSYERIETDRDTLLSTVHRLVSEGYDGFNCTMPLKTDMALLADKLGPEARDLCSANTVAVKDGRLYADTTDGSGILLTIRRACGNTSASPADCVRGKRVTLLGAGGAARSAALSLKNAGAELTILNRTLASAEALRTMLQTPCKCLTLTEENAVTAAKSSDILINCTAAGMAGQPEFASLAFIDALPSHALVIDAVYNPLETMLLKKSAARGLTAMSGLWMLVYQGALAFETWSGILPDEDACAHAFDLIK